MHAKLTALKNKQGGFTLIELLVVIGILAILLAITLFALNPTQHFQGARNAQRQSDVTAILDAIYAYESANSGNLPGGLAGATAGTVYTISTSATTPMDLCMKSGSAALLVPSYIADLPTDPAQATPRTPAGSLCNAATAYNTGYTIVKSASGNRFTVAAPLAEGGATISVTR